MEIPTTLTAFVERLKILYPDKWEMILRAFSQESVVTFRVNTLKAAEEEVTQALTKLGLTLEKIPVLASSYRLEVGDKKKLTNSPYWKDGLIAIQSLSSQLVSIVADPHPEELVLDACASPGSKTSHLAMLMHNRGNIVANDASYARVQKLKKVLEQLHVTNTICTQMPAEILWRDYENTFDRALVDVPCTMEGRIHFSDPDTYEDWSIKKIKRLSMEQKGILRSVIRCVKPGGIIVYSTCTLAPEENEEVIDWILRKEENLEVVPIHLDGIPTSLPVKSWNGTTYHPSVQHCCRIEPNELWEGFFIAKLRRKA